MKTKRSLKVMVLAALTATLSAGTAFAGDLTASSASASFNTSQNIDKGAITLQEMSGLYIYENYLYGIRINGAELRKYMEHAASFYGTTPDYNYDMIQGVDYTIDMNQPVGHRITKLQYQGKDVKDTDTFTMAINDYRMNGGSGYMAAMVALILDGQGGKLRAELSEFPTLTAYNNGCIRADASHNQGLAGDFWPYALYRYDAESDSYQRIARVDAWDGRLHPQDYDGNPFPKDADVSGAGIVYYVAEDGELYGEDGAFAPAPMDQADFEKWEASWQGSGSVVEVSLENEIVTDDLLAENAAG